MATSSSAESLRLMSLGLFAALIAVVIAWTLAADLSADRLLLALALTLPLWAPLHGLIHRNRRTYAWATLCVIPYFVLGLTESVANPAGRGWAAACLALAFASFAALIGYLRTTRPA
jgi:uncharacterized membrane protein